MIAPLPPLIDPWFQLIVPLLVKSRPLRLWLLVVDMLRVAAVSMNVVPVPAIMPEFQVEPLPVSVRSAVPLIVPLLKFILSTVTLLSTEALPPTIDTLSLVVGSAPSVQLPSVFQDPVELPHEITVWPNAEGKINNNAATTLNQSFLRGYGVRGAPFIWAFQMQKKGKCDLIMGILP